MWTASDRATDEAKAAKGAPATIAASEPPLPMEALICDLGAEIDLILRQRSSQYNCSATPCSSDEAACAFA
jgi:hypothetical protein